MRGKRYFAAHLCWRCDAGWSGSGSPLRLYITTPWGLWIIGEKSQVYDRKARKYTDRWAYVTYRPFENS